MWHPHIVFQHHAGGSGCCYSLSACQRGFRTEDRTLSGFAFIFHFPQRIKIQIFWRPLCLMICLIHVYSSQTDLMFICLTADAREDGWHVHQAERLSAVFVQCCTCLWQRTLQRKGEKICNHVCFCSTQSVTLAKKFPKFIFCIMAPFKH